MKELTLQDSVVQGLPDFSFLHLLNEEVSTARAHLSACFATVPGSEVDAGSVTIVTVTSVTKAEAKAAAVGLDPVLDMASRPSFFAGHLADRIDDEGAVTVHILDDADEHPDHAPGHTASRVALAFARAARADDPSCIILSIGHLEVLDDNNLDAVGEWMKRGFLAPASRRVLLEFEPEHLVR